jgi:hypothetical protein
LRPQYRPAIIDPMPEPTNSLLSRIYAIIRPLLFVGIVVYLAFEIAAGWDAVRDIRLEWNLVELLLAAATGVIAYQALLVAWLMLLRRTGLYRDGQLPLYARAWWQSFLYRYVPGKVFLLVERARLGEPLGIPRAAGAMLTVIETLLSVLAGSTVSLLAVLFYTDANPQLLTTVSLLALGTVFLFPPAYRLISSLPAIRRRYPEFGSVALRWQDVIAVTLPYLCYYLLLGLALFLVSRSVTPLPWSVLPGLCGVYALSHVVSLLAIVAPAGLGVREGALAVQLTRLVPQGVAGILAILARLWFTLIELLCYGLIVLITPAIDGAREKD